MGSQSLTSTGDAATFDTNQVLEGTDIEHTASTDTITLTGDGIYLITYSAVASNTTSSGTVGLELQNNTTTIPGSISSATITATSDVAPLSASVLVNATGSPAITLNSTENNVTLTNASIVVEKLN